MAAIPLPSSMQVNDTMTSYQRSSCPIRLRMPSTTQVVSHSDSRPVREVRPSSSLMSRSMERKAAPQRLNHAEAAGNDRFIPSRRQMNMDLCRSSFRTRNTSKESIETPLKGTRSITTAARQQREYHRYLRSSLYGIPLERFDENAELKTVLRFGEGMGTGTGLSCAAASERRTVNPFELDWLRSMKVGDGEKIVAVPPPQELPLRTKSPLDSPSCQLPASSYFQLDAFGVVDDYYLNLLSWSSRNNILAVALDSEVYLWNGSTRDMKLLVDVGEPDYIGSVKWCSFHGETHYIAITTAKEVLIYDTQAMREVYRMSGTSSRCCVMAWNDQRHLLTAGFRDGRIMNIDTRVGTRPVWSFAGHSSIVCGLSWHSEGSRLASGSNDRTVCVWDASCYHGNGLSNRVGDVVLREHVGAVKALGWCPFRRNVLATGAGLGDGTIKMWNTATGSLLSSTETGSPVSSILWSHDSCALYSGHGYMDNQIVVWHGPTMTRLEELKGHRSRILSMEMSPDGSSIASVGADEVVRFWKIREEVHRSSSLRNACNISGTFSLHGPVIR